MLIAGKAINRLLFLVRNILLAAAFGSSSQIAALMVAFPLINIPWRILGEGAMTSSFVPRFEALRAQDLDRALRLFRDVWCSATLASIALFIVAEVILLGLFFFADLPVFVHDVLGLAAILAPAIILMSPSSLQSAYLGCERRFFLRGIAPACVNLLWILAIIFLWHVSPSDAVLILAVVLVLGYVLLWLVTVPSTWSRVGGAFWRDARPLSQDVRRLGRAFLYAMVGYGALQLNLAVDPIFARMAAPGGPAYLWYAQSINYTALVIFGIGFTGVLLPSLARSVSERDTERYQRLLRFADQRVLRFMLPFTFAFLGIGLAFVNVLYGRGRFTGVDVVETTHCLWAYALGLLPETLILVQTGAFFANQIFHTPAMLTALSVGMNVVLNELFVMGFGLGPASVALATTLSMFTQSFFLYRGLRNRGIGVDTWRVMPLVGQLLVAGGVAWLATWSLNQWLFPGAHLYRTPGAQLLQFGALAACFLVVMYLVGIALRLHDWRFRFYK